MRIADVLAAKGTAVLTVSEDITVHQAIADMTRHNVGSLVVVAGDAVRGMFSERDAVRALDDRGAGALATPVGQIMTTTVLSCSPQDEVLEIAETMTEHRIRHLPVLSDGNLRGIVSIGDIVKSRIDELQSERDHLESYIQSG